VHTLWIVVAAPVAGVSSSDELVSFTAPEINVPVSADHFMSAASHYLLDIFLCFSDAARLNCCVMSLGMLKINRLTINRSLRQDWS